MSNINSLKPAGFFLLPLLGLFLSCNNSSQTPDKENNGHNTETATTIIPKREENPEVIASQAKISYTLLTLKGNDSARKLFMKQYQGEARTIILSLNRIDEKHLSVADTLIIPDTIINNFLVYSPFPDQVDLLKEVKKIVIFSYSIQAYALYEAGKLVKWGPTSMGSKIHLTPTGLLFANWKSKRAVSTVKDEWILNWNFNVQNQMGVGWHEYALPGYPASHSCLRLLEADAQWLYSWADQWVLKDNRNLLAHGTPVIVYGSYPFGSRRPWRNMADNADANKISEDIFNKEIEPFLNEILEAQKQRAEITTGAQNTNASAQAEPAQNKAH